MTPDISVDHSVGDEVGVVNQVDMIPDKRLDVVTVLGKPIPSEGTFLKSCLLQKQLPSGLELGNTADHRQVRTTDVLVSVLRYVILAILHAQRILHFAHLSQLLQQSQIGCIVRIRGNVVCLGIGTGIDVQFFQSGNQLLSGSHLLAI